jgi:hypothetical protein
MPPPFAAQSATVVPSNVMTTATRLSKKLAVDVTLTLVPTIPELGARFKLGAAATYGPTNGPPSPTGGAPNG